MKPVSFLTRAGIPFLFLLAGANPAMATDIYVDAAASGANDGSSWTNAYTDLQAALAAAVDGDSIRVAEGTYKPTSGTDRALSFQLPFGVTLEGGYPAGGGERDPVHKSILSGDIGTAGDNSDNAYHVVTFRGEEDGDATAVLDGFTITAGNANGDWWEDADGGGMKIQIGSPRLMNLTLADNAAHRGGGLYTHIGNPKLTAVTFANNSAAYTGGGLHMDSATALTNVTFSGNSAGERGGGLYLDDKGYATMVQITFSGNSAGYTGGGFFDMNDVEMDVNNSILWGNSPDQFDIGKGFVDVYDSVIEGGCPTSSRSCTNIITADPLLGPLGDNGGYTPTIPLLAGSSAIDTGADSNVDVDQRGVTRPQGDGFDIGAFEYLPQGDVTPPVILNLIASPDRLWPPNGRLVLVVVIVRAMDEGDGLAGALLTISDEYGERNGVVEMRARSRGLFTAVVPLTAWRRGGDRDGRIYTLNVSVSDQAGNSSQATTLVIVPHDLGRR